MKTELEWVSVEKGYPIEGVSVIGIINLKKESPILGYPIMVHRFEGKWRSFDSRICFEGNNLTRVTFTYFKNYELTHWAYVNLPEEEEKAMFQCEKCKKSFEKEKSYQWGFFLICKECKEKEEPTETFRSHEFRGYPLQTEEEPWIWPLKQLPEEGQEVEMKFLDGEECIGDYLYKIFRVRGQFACPIAWRPLNEEKKKIECEVGEIGPKCFLRNCVRCKRFFSCPPQRLKESLCFSCWHTDSDEKPEKGDILKNEVTGKISIFYDGIWYDLDTIFKNPAHNAVCGSCQESPCSCKRSQERIPDFSKLKEGDLIWIYGAYDIKYAGYFSELKIDGRNRFILSISFAPPGNGSDNMEICEDEIKKIIRINVGEPTKMVHIIEGHKKTEVNVNDAYYFEEI